MFAEDEESHDEELEAEFNRALGWLPDLEVKVLDLYFGLHAEPLTLYEVADRLGVTAREARDLKESALERLRRGNDDTGGAVTPVGGSPRPPSAGGPQGIPLPRHAELGESQEVVDFLRSRGA